MSGKWRLTDRTRLLLTLELSIMLPAALLMFFSISNLHHIQRDKAIEAAIQRDFSHVLYIAEKKAYHKAADMLIPVRKQFPCGDDAATIKPQLDAMLAAHPEFLYAILYDKDHDLFTWRLQPAREGDEAFRKRMADLMTMTSKWFPLEAPELAHKLRMTAEKEEMPFGSEGGWTDRNDEHYYWSIAYFIPPDVPKGSVVLGVVGFDPEYLRNSFFPAVITDVLTSKSSVLRADASPPAMMVHPQKSSTPWVTSSNWDGGKAEMDRPLEYIFQGMVLAIKYPGTTIDEIGAKILRNNYIILAALALIRLYAETLELGRLTAQEKYQEYFRIIREESERLTALINNILDFSRIEAGRKEYEFKETNLAELVRATLDSYRFQIEQNGFAFEENISGDIPPLNVDREAIARSLLNLVNNALKYSKDQKYIGVSLYRANSRVNLEVRDRGIGIPANEQEKIFEKFYRCGDPLVHNIKGSGLGLSLVRHIARAHGGDVLVESTREKGSKFTIALPLDPALRTAEAAA